MTNQSLKAQAKVWDQLLGTLYKPTPEQLWLQNLPQWTCKTCGESHIFEDSCMAPDDMEWSMEEMYETEGNLHEHV